MPIKPDDLDRWAFQGEPFAHNEKLNLAFAADALEKSGLVSGRDFHLIVIGIDPKDSLADARLTLDCRG